jgi:hypothetical protein
VRDVVFFITICGMAQSIWFEPNQGQIHPVVQFLARTGRGYAYFGPSRMAVPEVRMH